jgi:hypothetical protein
MKWIGTRISYVDKDNKTTFIIQPEHPAITKALIGAWFCMWIAIGAVVTWYWATHPMKKELQLILLVFMIFWLYYFIRVGRSFFWLMWGKEMLKIDKISLTVKNSIKGYGKAKEFYLENIDKIRVSVPEKNSFQTAWENSPWIRGGERIEFDYMGKTVRFGRKLDEKESKLLFQVVTKRIEDHLRKKKQSGE